VLENRTNREGTLQLAKISVYQLRRIQMATFCRSLYFMIFITAWVPAAIAQAPKPPYALFDQATLTGSGNTITATQIPVVTATGAIVYLSATLQFNVDANGGLTLSTGYPQVSAAPTVITGNFKAGRYVGPSTILGGKGIVSVMGPGLTDGGATEWTLSAASGADPYTYPGSASWYVGSITNPNHPLAARLSKAGITSTAWSYGVGSAYNTNNWLTNSLIGVSQVGNTITIASFTSSGPTDHNVPVDQITYTLAPNQ
jgi:hypothetical protein